MTSDQKITATLDTITGTGKFSTIGDSKFFFPEIQVHGEVLAFPIPPSQAKHLISLAENAPFGMGEKTVIDPEVRKCWQIDAEYFHAPQTEKWRKYLKSILADVAEQMGVQGKIIADPYKLLIYEKGGHFHPHTDTEKIPGMFGTLIISLPSKHSGGELYIRHNDSEEKVDFSKQTTKSTSSIRFEHVAFFANCEHEVKQVTEGYRVCLVYNLAIPNKEAMIFSSNLNKYVNELVPALNNLKTQAPNKLRAILLNHQYTEDQFSLKTLKNEDFTKANALLEAAKQAGYTAHLGLVTLHQSGELEGVDFHYSRRGRYYDDYEDTNYDAGTMGEIYDESLSVQLGTKKNPVGNYSIKKSNLLPAVNLNQCETEPIEKEAEGPTGNAGCSMDYWYRKAAIVLWPKECDAEIMCQYDLHGAASVFKDYKTHKLSKESATALGIAVLTKMISTKGNFHLPLNELMGGICQLKSDNMLKQCLDHYSHQKIAELEEKAWKGLFKAFTPEHFIEHFESLPSSLSKKSSVSFTQPLAALLVIDPESALMQHLINAASTHKFHTSSSEWEPMAELLGKRNTSTANDIHLLIAISSYTQTSKARKGIEKQIYNSLDLNYIRTTLSKALIKKTHQKHFTHPQSLYKDTLSKTCNTLEKEVNRHIEDYPNWTRPYQGVIEDHWYRNSPTGMAPFYKQLEAFCLDPEVETYEFKTNAEYRNALAEHIKTAKLDFDCSTIKKGSPHILHLKKNNKSYHRSLKQREADITLLKKLKKFNAL